MANMYAFTSFRKATLAAAFALTGLTVQAQTIYGLANGSLVSIDAMNPAAAMPGIAISGIAAGQQLVGLDARPATGQLFVLGYNAASSEARLYTIDPTSGAASAVGAASISLNLGNAGVGFDFNPTVDRIRVVGQNGMNYRLNPITGGIAATDAPLFYASGDRFAGMSPAVSAVAYTNSYFGAQTTTLYDVDPSAAALLRQDPPNNGQLNSVTPSKAALLPGFEDMDIRFNPATQMNTAYAVRSSALGSFLLKLDLGTGAVEDLGLLSGLNVTDIALQIVRPPLGPVQGSLVYGLGINNALVSFDSQNPGVLRSSVPITGVAAPQLIVGMDVRPATGEIFILGYNRGGQVGRLYTVNPATGVATPVGSSTFSADLGSTRNIGFDFNPTVDRIRVVSTNNLNLRLNPITGGIAATDLMLNYAAADANAGRNPAIGAAAYTNSFAGSTATTLYTYDDSTNSLNTQVPPNNGTQNTVGRSGVLFATSDGGVDIDIVSDGMGGNMAFASGRPNRESVSSFYSVNLATGAFTSLGRIGDGIQVRDIAIAINAGSPPPVGRSTSTLQTLTLYPNPADGDNRLTLTYEQKEPAVYTAVVLDAFGKQMKKVSLGSYRAGEHADVLDISGLKTGFYQVQILADGKLIASSRLIR